MDIDIGDEVSGHCIINGMWLFHIDKGPAALLVSHLSKYEGTPGVRIEVIASPKAGGRDEAQAILATLATELTTKSVYKGRALSFETTRTYLGGLGALKVHRFPEMSLDQIILPSKTLETLRRQPLARRSSWKKAERMGFSILTRTFHKKCLYTQTKNPHHIS